MTDDSLDVAEAQLSELRQMVDRLSVANAVPPPPAVPATVPPPPALPASSQAVTMLPASKKSPFDLPGAFSGLTFNSKDQYEATRPNLRFILNSPQLQAYARFGFDEFRSCIMIARPGIEDWKTLTDTDITHLGESLERIHGFAPIGREMLREMLQLVAEEHRFDSAIMWLDGLVWDGVPRIERFFAEYCGSSDDEYTRAVGMYMWSGLAGRTLDPGCQLDMVIAMQSPQGAMKSTAMRDAVSPSPDTFTDGLSLQHDDDNFKRLLRGKLVVEIAEMVGVSKADVELIKRVITRRTEKWVEKYLTQETKFERRCMFFATTNKQEFLPADDTGHRRWLPIPIVELNRERIAADREQLWAEGAAIWRAMGIQYADAERLAKGKHAAHEQHDVWETQDRRLARDAAEPRRAHVAAAVREAVYDSRRSTRCNRHDNRAARHAIR